MPKLLLLTYSKFLYSFYTWVWNKTEPKQTFCDDAGASGSLKEAKKQNGFLNMKRERISGQGTDLFTQKELGWKEHVFPAVTNDFSPLANSQHQPSVTHFQSCPFLSLSLFYSQ